MRLRPTFGTKLVAIGLTLTTCYLPSTAFASDGLTSSQNTTVNTTVSTTVASDTQAQNTAQTSSNSATDSATGNTTGNTASTTTANATENSGVAGSHKQPSTTNSANTTGGSQSNQTSTSSTQSNVASNQKTTASASIKTSSSTSAKTSSSVNPPALTLGATSSYVLYLQEVLAKLGYLPLNFSKSSALTTTNSTQAPYAPIQGGWTWKYKNTPMSLKAQWGSSVYNQMTRGAVMTFQEVNHLTIDGVTGPNTWAALTTALKLNKRNPNGYAYVYTSTGRPETLKIWLNGRYVFSTLVNTGISAAPTPYGTWPIYVRYTSQTMSGHTPSGAYYSDPGVPWVNYFYGGCAIHGFVRASYGSPQSLGCIELPIYKAQIAWNYLHYGTLVTVGQ